MIHKLMGVAVVGLLAASSLDAQQNEQPRPRRSGVRAEQPAPKPGGEMRQKMQNRIEARRKHHQHDGADQPGGDEKTRRERARAFLEKHPGVRARLHAAADRDGDGKLSEVERAEMKRILYRKMEAARDVRQDRREGRRKERLDRNDDGKVGPGERRRASKVKDRLDRNDDGKVGPGERRRASKVKGRLDRNDDGRVGRRERQRAHDVHQRRHDQRTEAEKPKVKVRVKVRAKAKVRVKARVKAKRRHNS